QHADTTRRERIGRYASRVGIDGMARLERLRQRWSGRGLDAHDPGGASIPGRDPADQTAAAYGHQHGVEGRRLRRKLQAYRPLAQERLDLVEGVHRQCARFFRPVLAGRESVRIALTPDGQVRAVAADPVDLRRGGDRRNENLGGDTEPHGGIGNSGAVIPARGGDHARLRDFSPEQVGECATRLERSRVLKLLELERERKKRKAKIRAADLNDRRHTDVRLDDGMRRFDALPVDRYPHGACYATGADLGSM